MVHIPFHTRDKYAHNVHWKFFRGQVDYDHVLQPCFPNVGQELMHVLLERGSGT